MIAQCRVPSLELSILSSILTRSVEIENSAARVEINMQAVSKQSVTSSPQAVLSALLLLDSLTWTVKLPSSSMIQANRWV